MRLFLSQSEACTGNTLPGIPAEFFVVLVCILCSLLAGWYLTRRMFQTTSSFFSMDKGISCWDIPENQKIELTLLDLVWLFLTRVLISWTKSTHDLSDDSNWWKDALAVLFLPPMPSECQHNLLQTLLRARTGCSQGSRCAESNG